MTHISNFDPLKGTPPHVRERIAREVRRIENPGRNARLGGAGKSGPAPVRRPSPSIAGGGGFLNERIGTR